MNNIEIEELLRNNKPQVPDHPAFLLELRQKMRAVEGIKAEVDRQRKYSRLALIGTFAAVLLLSCAVMLAACLIPPVSDWFDEEIIGSLRDFLQTWKPYLPLPIAGCAIALGLLFGRPSTYPE